jgi:hypothetical protein
MDLTNPGSPVTDTHTKSMIACQETMSSATLILVLIKANMPACKEQFNSIRMVINTTKSQRPLVTTSVDSKQATVDYGYQPEPGTRFRDLDLSLINTSWNATVLTTI